MKRQLLYIVDGEFKSYEQGLEPNPLYGFGLAHVDRHMQAAYEFGRQEKAQEILEALVREFFKEEKP
jgi:hypothetical protein